MIRINLMPFEERGQKARRPQAARKSGGASAVLLPLAIVAGVPHINPVSSAADSPVPLLSLSAIT